MKKTTLVAALVVAPAALFAQAGTQARASANVKAAGPLSADAQSQVDAQLKVARERNLPEQPIRRRVAEGEAKGASDAQIVAASRRVLVDLQTSHDAMVRAGRTQPSDAEVERGAQLMARGFTSAQIESIASTAPPDRSLTVAFDVLTSLQAQGKPTANAVAQVQGQLAARASDAQLRGLASAVGANAGATVNGLVGASSANGTASGSGAASATGGASSAGSAAGSAAAGVNGAVGAAAASRPVTGAVTGSVTGTLTGGITRKP